jgi:hypothetical protein
MGTIRRSLGVTALVLLLEPEALAQPVAAEYSARTVPMQAEIAAQASFDTSYLLALYMMQLAAAGAPPSQADIDEAVRQYLTHGAAVNGVPSAGPGAEYFRNGAAVTGAPSSGPVAAYFHDGSRVMAYSTARATPPQDATNPAGAGSVASEPYAEDAGAPQQALATTIEGVEAGASEAQPVRVPEGDAGPMGLTCSPLEIEAAIAIAGGFATAAAPPRSAASTSPPTASNRDPLPVETARAVEPVHGPEAGPVPQGPAGPSLPGRIAPALAGAVLGGLALALWSRPRRLRIAHGR